MRKIFIAIVLAAGAAAAQAGPIQFNFTISGFSPQAGFPADPVADGAGFVVFDPDLIVPAGGNGFVGDGVNALPSISLSLDWLGQHYDSTTAALWAVNFIGGLPASWAIGGLATSCGGVQTFGCVANGVSDFDLLTSQNGTGFIVMAIDGVEGNARGTVSWQQVPVTAVPEPATLGLMVLGLAGLAQLRRRKPRA
jgi:hypothetical protein